MPEGDKSPKFTHILDSEIRFLVFLTVWVEHDQKGRGPIRSGDHFMDF